MTKLFHLIKKYEKYGDFTHYAVTNEMLNDAEKRLQTNIPLKYLEHWDRLHWDF